MRRRILAWSMHLFTATGAIWGFLAILAIQQHDWKAAIAWMILAMFVDGFDGMLAQRFETPRLAASIDGALLDNILDYLNYVVVPVFFLWEADFLPAGSKLWVAIAILLSSAYQFTQIDAKTEDHYFKGFPCYWNVMVIYMLVLQLPAWVNLAFTIFFVILIFVPVKYLYPSRNIFPASINSCLNLRLGNSGHLWSDALPQGSGVAGAGLFRLRRLLRAGKPAPLPSAA